MKTFIKSSCIANDLPIWYAYNLGINKILCFLIIKTFSKVM